MQSVEMATRGAVTFTTNALSSPCLGDARFDIMVKLRRKRIILGGRALITPASQNHNDVAEQRLFLSSHSRASGVSKTPPRVRARVPDEHSHEEEISHVGEREVWGAYQPFGLTEKDRAQHVYCLGKSGTGKTTFLRNLLIQDIEAGKGVALIDVHGDLARELLDYIPPERFDHLVYFSPGDTEHPIGLNPFFGVEEEHRHVVASNIVGAFKSIWRESWGVRMEYVLYAAIATLLECKGSTLQGVLRLFTDQTYRRRIVRQLDDPMLRSFWADEFERWPSHMRNEIILPIQNKVGTLLMTPMMRNILGQVKTKVNLRFMMDESRIFIANLNKGALGEDKANLLGSLIIAEIQYAALSRGNLDVGDRVPFTLCVDEFQNFQTDSFATILSEARKYGLSLVLSHQFSTQLHEDIAAAVFGNAGSIIAFRVGHEDARKLSAEFGDEFPPRHFTALSNYAISVKLLRDGQVMQPFQGRTLPPLGIRYGMGRRAIRNSRQKYGASRKKVESKHRKWLNS